MKLLIVVSLLIFVNCEIDLKTFDWSSVKPLEEIKEWRDVQPKNAEVATVHSSRAPRIVNGEIATQNEFPYMAGVILHFDTGNSWCGGSLISRLFVLTAANCVHIVPSASVLLGASNVHNVEANIRVAQIRVHSQFDLDLMINDIATLELSRQVDLSATIGIVRLPNRRQTQLTFDNQQATVSG